MWTNMEEIAENEESNTEKKYFRILGITYWRIFAYFIVYSIIGYVIETAFGLIKYGLLESRQSFLYGPFCAIYGIGAILMILSLQYFKKNYNTLFIGGCIVGSIIEYLVSWIGEMLFGIKWWDYSDVPFNINGRICLMYAVFWGALGLYLMISVNPKIDALINFIKERLPIRLLQSFVCIGVIFMLIDCIATALALSCFTVRTIEEKDIVVKNQEYIHNLYQKIYNDEFKVKIINKYLNNEKMLITFPRVTIEDINGKIIMVKDLYPDIKTYYVKVTKH